MEKNVKEEKNLTQNELGEVAGGGILGLIGVEYCYETCPKCGAVLKAEYPAEAKQKLDAHMTSCTGGGASGGW